MELQFLTKKVEIVVGSGTVTVDLVTLANGDFVLPPEYNGFVVRKYIFQAVVPGWLPARRSEGGSVEYSVMPHGPHHTIISTSGPDIYEGLRAMSALSNPA